ncbi:MAG: hypothetical protein C0631_10405 [Sedimenticola sp.]|nr:MAG: hypothetical protein C0631_10405 [Sedimenticola sp.]
MRTIPIVERRGSPGNQQAIFSCIFKGLSEYGIFHGITIWQENKLLNIKDKKGLFTIEWE